MRLSILLLLSLMPLTAQYTARRTLADGVEVIRLGDAAHHTSLSVAPSIGNIAFELMVNGHNSGSHAGRDSAVGSPAKIGDIFDEL
jgi:hypothetical protein